MCSFFLAFGLGSYFNLQLVQVYNDASKFVALEGGLPQKTAESFTASIIVPAVDQDGRGVSTIIEVTAAPGTGRSLLNVNNLLFMADTQASIRTSKDIARAITGKNTSSYDLIYTITANATVIEGPSAGAALAAATTAAIMRIDLNRSIMVTGTANSQGQVGPVGGVLEKAKAAKSIGAELFLVPLTQSRQVIYHTENVCRQVGFTQICGLETRSSSVDIAESAGIKIIEVSTVAEVMEYFEPSKTSD